MINENQIFNLSEQPLSIIPVLHQMTHGMLDSAEDELKHLLQAKHNPGTLDKETISTILNEYTEQQKIMLGYQKQLQQWRSCKLNSKQLMWVKEIECNITVLKKITQEILTLAREIEKHAISEAA